MFLTSYAAHAETPADYDEFLQYKIVYRVGFAALKLPKGRDGPVGGGGSGVMCGSSSSWGTIIIYHFTHN